jgi:hypothetical protein
MNDRRSKTNFDFGSAKPSKWGKSNIWDNTTWSRILRNSGLRETPLAKASSNCKLETPLYSEKKPYNNKPANF